MTRNDDADGGQRGLRPALSRQLVNEIGRAFGITVGPGLLDLGGSSSLNLLAGNTERFVVRVHRTHVTPARLDAANIARRALSAVGMPTTTPLATREGNDWLFIENHLVEVEPYIEHDSHMDTWDRLETGMQLLGRVHSVLRGIDVPAAGKRPLFANHIESHDAVELTSQGARRIRSWGPSARELKLAADAELLAHRVYEAERPVLPDLPRQLIHGDFWDNNVLFRAEDLVHLGDFDFMGDRARIDDLALTLYFTCMKFPGDVTSARQVAALQRLLHAYDSGSDTPLTAIERAALPLAMARQPLWSIGGWVARLDDDETARLHAAGTASNIAWALGIMANLHRWQNAFATRA